MHKIAIVAAAAATILCAGSLSMDRADAATFGPSAGMRSAIADVSPVESAHYRQCWRGYHRWHCRRHHRHCWWGYGRWHCRGGYRY
jgi:hypothetical protein